MSGLEVVGLVLTLVDLGRRIALAVKDAKDLSETVKDYIANIENHLALIKQSAERLDGPDPLFAAGLKQLSEELEQLVHACEEKYLRKWSVSQRLKHFLSGEDVNSKIIAINNKVHLIYVQCLLILHIGTEVHLTSFESKLDLPVSTIYQATALARDEVRGDLQTIISSLQRIEHKTHQDEKSPTREVSDGVITTQDIHAQAMSGTVEKMLFNSRFKLLLDALERDIPLLPFPSDLKRVYDADEEYDVILDDALAGCILLVRQLCYRKPLDRMQHFLNLRILLRQLIALGFWEAALKLSPAIIALLHDFRIYLPNEFLLDLIVAFATQALLLGANSQLAEAKSECDKALVLTKQLATGDNAHPIYPLIHRITAYFVDDIPSRLTYLMEAARYYKSILPSSLELYILPFAETLSSLGRCYLKQHKPSFAIEVLEEAKDIFCSTPFTPPDDLIICFIRLGRAFQATGQLSRANEVLEKAYNALKCTQKTSLRELLARVRQENGIPSSVSCVSDPAIILPSVFRAESSIGDNNKVMLSSTLLRIDGPTTNGLSPPSVHGRLITDAVPLSSNLLIPAGAEITQLICSVVAVDADSVSLDDPTPRVVKDKPLPDVEVESV